MNNKYWENHQQKENVRNNKLRSKLKGMFYSKNKYNFMLNKHYKEEDETKCVKKERRIFEWKELKRQERFGFSF